MENKIIREVLTTEELVNQLSFIVNNGDKAILDLNDNWYKIGVTDLEAAPIPTHAYYFEENINITALFSRLQSKVVFVSPLPHHSGVYIVDKFVYTPMDYWNLFHE